jgi:intraflagellar transport protein 172
MRLAVATSDRKINLFEENGNKKEVFSTKPSGANKNYQIREILFNPDSTKLAIAQTDNIIFVYKLGPNWGEKKSICNKFEQSSSVTCMVWSRVKANEIYFGLSEGKIKVGLLNKNASNVLYSHETPVISLATSLDGKFLLSGHTDMTILKFNIENSNFMKLVVNTCVPYCLAWGNQNSILAAGNDYRVNFYNDIGKKLQNFDYSSNDDKLKEFTVCKVSNSGDAIALGNFNQFYVFLYNGRKQQWEQYQKFVDGLYSITAICWKPDGSALITGSINGTVNSFEACLKKSMFKDIFEITYISHNQVIIKNTQNQKRLIIKPKTSNEIIKINIYLDNYVVIFTKESLIVGDLNLEKSSEINWKRSGQEKFDFKL